MKFQSCLLLGLGLLLPLGAQSFAFEPFSIDGAPTYARSINNQGFIVGFVQVRDRDAFGFLRRPDGTFDAPIRAPGSTILTGITNLGMVVGHYSWQTQGLSATLGFTVFEGKMKAYDFSIDEFAYYTDILGVNSAGDFVGRRYGGGYARIGEVVSDIDFPNGVEVTPTGIGWDQTIVGWYRGATSTALGYLRGPQKNILKMRIANARNVYPQGINSAAGKIVGTFEDLGGVFHGFIYDYVSDLGSLNAAAGIEERTIPVQVVDYPGR